MAGIRKQITARRVSLGFILLLAGTMILTTIVPQEMVTPPGDMASWREGHQGLLWLIDGAQLHRVYAQPWFAVAILCAGVSLSVSSWDQLVSAGKRLHAAGTASAEEIAAGVREGHLRAIAGRRRYRESRADMGGVIKLVRNPWGYYGNFLLHLGMVLSIAASLYVALTGRQGALLLVEGETCDSRQPWAAAEHGIMAAPLAMPGSVRLDRVDVRFDEKNQPSSVSSHISVIRDTGTDSLTSTINTITRYRGLRIYHAAQYGDAFTLEFRDEMGVRHLEKLNIQQPAGLTVAGYGDFELPWSKYVLSAKYYADAERKSMASSNPQLVLRLLAGKNEVTRTSLAPGGSGVLGNYLVHLVGVQKWSKLIFVDVHGMPVIFAGFAIIMLGGFIHYMTPPRELIGVRGNDGLYRVYWKAPSFRAFFVEERDELASALKEEESG
jgi:hypothetical protein